MGMADTIDLDCGIAYGRIAGWLDDELALPSENNAWTYACDGGSCRVAIEPLENRSFGLISLERTHLLVQGDETALASFYKLFTLRFLSAGG
jgi:hypothetical protein